VKSALLTVHEDNRIRIWDVKDGRCVNISEPNIFEESGTINICE